MAKLKKGGLKISNKIKFRKPSKSLSNKPTNHLEFKRTVPSLAPYAVQAAKAGLLTRRQLETGRIILKRRVKNFNGRVVVLIQPDRIVTKRALETRMGRGKGAPNKQVALISKGQLLYAIEGPPKVIIEQVFKKMQPKITVPTVLISTFVPYNKPRFKFKRPKRK